jgi:hypothetical protein
MSKTTCAKCGGRMEQGFVPDAGQHASNVSVWVEGAPLKSFWGGVKVKREAQRRIETWRCGRCHYLESYAPG